MLVFNGGTANCVTIGTNLSCTITTPGGRVYGIVLPLSTVPTIGNTITITIIPQDNPGLSGLQISNATIIQSGTETITIPRPVGDKIKLCVNDTPGAMFLQTRQKCSFPAVAYTIVGNTVTPPNANITVTSSTITVGHLSNSVVETIPDTDNDGLFDDEDQCPAVAGTVYNGCPFSDITIVTTHIAGAKITGECGLKDGKNINECKKPTEGAVVKVFDRENTDFINAFGTKKPKKEIFGNIFTSNLGMIASCTTNASGTCQVGEDHAGKYIVIVKLTDGSQIVYNGKFKEFKKQLRANHDDDEDEIGTVNPKYFTITKKIHFTKVINKNGGIKYTPSINNNFDGSLLEVLRPEYTIWENDTELYPFILTSDDTWTTDICLSVPAGYKVNGVLDIDGNVIAVSDCIQSFIAGESKTFLFQVTDIGSPEPTFGLNITTTHKGKKVKNSLTVEGVRIKTKNVTDKDLNVKIEKAQKVKGDREGKNGKQVAVATPTSKVATLWAKVQNQLASTSASTDTVKAAVKEVAKKNDIAIPEWGISGTKNSRSMTAAIINALDLSFLSSFFR